jgi:hypothetical protein
MTEQLERPVLAPPGEPCVECGTPLARDQRYCLSCGARRAGLPTLLAGDAPRSPVSPVPPAPAVETAVGPPPADSPWRLDLGLVAGVGCLLLALLVGVLIGRAGGNDDQRTAAAPQVVTIGGTPTPTPTAGGTAAPVSFTSDWPAGKRGFTVQLQTLPKDGTDAAAVAAAKKAATDKGVKDVGALDSDQFSSLDGGQYVIYSGQYADRKAARAALKDAKSAFGDAKVIEVSDSTDTAAAPAASQKESAKAINDLNSSSGEDYSKKSAKLPNDLVTPGKPPPKDDKPAGGGSAVETFP